MPLIEEEIKEVTLSPLDIYFNKDLSNVSLEELNIIEENTSKHIVTLEFLNEFIPKIEDETYTIENADAIYFINTLKRELDTFEVDLEVPSLEDIKDPKLEMIVALEGFKDSISNIKNKLIEYWEKLKIWIKKKIDAIFESTEAKEKRQKDNEERLDAIKKDKKYTYEFKDKDGKKKTKYTDNPSDVADDISKGAKDIKVKVNDEKDPKAKESLKDKLDNIKDSINQHETKIDISTTLFPHDYELTLKYVNYIMNQHSVFGLAFNDFDLTKDISDKLSETLEVIELATQYVISGDTNDLTKLENALTSKGVMKIHQSMISGKTFKILITKNGSLFYKNEKPDWKFINNLPIRKSYKIMELIQMNKMEKVFIEKGNSLTTTVEKLIESMDKLHEPSPETIQNRTVVAMFANQYLLDVNGLSELYGRIVEDASRYSFKSDEQKKFENTKKKKK